MEMICTTRPKAKKQHICNLCGGIINVGEIYERQFNKYDDVYVFKSHLSCIKLASQLNLFGDCDEGLTGDYFRDYITEFYMDISSNDCEDMPDFATMLKIVSDYINNK